MKRLIKTLPVAVCLLWAAAARADVVVEVAETWSSGLAGWTNTSLATTLSNPGGNTYLSALFGAEGEPPDPAMAADLIRTFSEPATNWFTGDYLGGSNAVAGVRFDFYADDVAPSKLEVRFGSGAREWAYELDTPAVDTWTTENVWFNYGAWEGGPGTTEADFLADLQAVDWIGVYIERSGLGEQDFFIDNFMLFVPEPGQVCLLASALLSIALAAKKGLSPGKPGNKSPSSPA